MQAFDCSGGAPGLVQRARPLLGTLVSIQVRTATPALTTEPLDMAGVHSVVDKAFAVMQDIEQAMSAHRLDSDLARLARAVPGGELQVSTHTVAVLRLAHYWHRISLGAFDPVRAANRLSAHGMRPAFRGVALAPGVSLQALTILADDRVQVAQPLRLDLGGIAKGYAVDCAIAALNAGGIATALVNAGGDLRACGAWAWPVQIRSASAPLRSSRLKGLRALSHGALATSAGASSNIEFVPTARLRSAPAWSTCTVRAPDCVTADALTKWGLQAAPGSPRLQRVLRRHGAAMWSA